MEMIKAENLSYEYIKVTETEKGTKEEKILNKEALWRY